LIESVDVGYTEVVGELGDSGVEHWDREGSSVGELELGLYADSVEGLRHRRTVEAYASLLSLIHHFIEFYALFILVVDAFVRDYTTT